jgi:hypothetical protein
MFTMKSEVVGRPPVASDDLVRIVDEIICIKRLFTISELSCEFPQILCTLLKQFITVRLGCHKFCTGWVPKMLKGAQKNRKE